MKCECVNDHGGMNEADIEMRPFELLSVVCERGGVTCPLVAADRVRELSAALRHPACRIKFVTNADQVPFYRDRTAADWASIDPEDVFNRKRDLDVLQKLGLAPGSVSRSRFVFEWLFIKIQTLVGLCAYDTANWTGCEHARSGAYERVQETGTRAIVDVIDADEAARRKKIAAEEIAAADHLYIQPHILMCICCRYDGGNHDNGPDHTDEAYELRKKMKSNPDIPVTLVDDGLCMICGSCDGFDRETCRCVHTGGLIRNFKKNLDVLQRLGLMPGATMPARELYKLIFERIPSTRLIAAYGDGVVTSHEWGICGDPEGNPAYERTRDKPFI